MVELARAVEELQGRVKSLEAQVQEMREMLPSPVDTKGGELPWEVVEVEGVMKKWYGSVKQAVMLSASRDEEGGWVNTSTIEMLNQLPLDQVMSTLSPFCNEQRLKVLRQLSEYPKSATDLGNATGLQGGQLYHHLEELMEARYVEKVYRGKYRLTNIGRWAFYNTLHTVHHLSRMRERGEERGLGPEGEEVKS